MAPKYVILDLDHTVVDVSDVCYNCDKHVRIVSNGLFNYVHIRPYTKELIETCLRKNIEIIIYSANNRVYIDSILNILFTDYAKPSKIMTKHDMVANVPGGYQIKTLMTVAIKYNLNVNDLLAIDDNRDNYPNDSNVIYVDPWYKDMVDDKELLKIIVHVGDV